MERTQVVDWIWTSDATDVVMKHGMKSVELLPLARHLNTQMSYIIFICFIRYNLFFKLVSHRPSHDVYIQPVLASASIIREENVTS